METKGNPVDSVIQYQLHKKTSGEGGDSFNCAYSDETPLKIEPVFVKTYDGITQEDLNNDIYLRYNGLSVTTSKVVRVETVDITPQDLLDNKIPFIIEKITFEETGNSTVWFITLNEIQLSGESFESSIMFDLVKDRGYVQYMISDSLTSPFMIYNINDK